MLESSGDKLDMILSVVRSMADDIELIKNNTTKKKRSVVNVSDKEIRKAALAIYNVHYPRKIGRTKGLDWLEKNLLKNEIESFKKACINYAKHCESESVETKYIKHFSTWVKEWHDYVDMKHKRTMTERLDEILGGEE